MTRVSLRWVLDQIPPTPPPWSRDEEIYDAWRNRSCPTHRSTWISCFGMSPLYGAEHAVRAVREDYGCATIAELRVEVTRHGDGCRCWRHAVLRVHEMRARDW